MDAPLCFVFSFLCYFYVFEKEEKKGTLMLIVEMMFWQLLTGHELYETQNKQIKIWFWKLLLC